MKSMIYTSEYIFDENSAEISLSGLYHRMYEEFGTYDYLIFALHPDLDIEQIAKSIYKIFKTENFIVFHAIEHFNYEQIVENSLSVCCLRFEKKASVKHFYLKEISKQSEIDKAVDYFNTNTDKFHIVFAGLSDGNIGSVIEEISSRLTYEPINNIVGGVSSGIKKENRVQAFQYVDHQLIENGFVVLTFENIEAFIDIALGFHAYGITYKIAKAEGNKLYTVDDGKSFPYIAKKMLNAQDTNLDIQNLWYCPLNILDDENGYTLTLRTVADIKKHYVEFFAPLKKGDYFKLSFATSDDLILADKKVADELIKKMPHPEISFNFSCIARQYVLEDKQEKELEAYTEKFQTNLFGFFTFGEIGPDKMYKKLKFYNETSLAVVMREK